MSPKSKKSVVDVMLEKGELYYGDDKRFKLQRIPIGIPDLDDILNGGIPRGRISIFVGEYSSGKSYLVQALMKNAMKKGMRVAYVDTEKTYDPDWWKQVGLDIKKILVTQPNTGEQATDAVLKMAHAGVDVIAVDSLAALIPTEEAEQEDSKQKFIGLQARLINKLLRRLLSFDHNSAMVFTNQLRDSMGPFPFDNMPGGQGQWFFASVILRTRRDKWMEEKGKKVGFHMKIICRKSKVGKPLGECVLPFKFRGEIDMLSLTVDRAIEAGIVTQKGPWFSVTVGEDVIDQLGRNAFVQAMKENPTLLKHIETALGDS